jgi:hypothetical protein
VDHDRTKIKALAKLFFIGSVAKGTLIRILFAPIVILSQSNAGERMPVISDIAASSVNVPSMPCPSLLWHTCASDINWISILNA